MSTTGISVHAQRFEPNLNELCHASWSCELAAIVEELWVLFVVGVFALVILAALSNIRAGLDTVETEQFRVAAERDAFETFATRVSELAPDRSGTVGGANGATVAAVAVGEPGRSRAKVREAYRETVMALPHYDEDYGEPLEENMAVEFGADISAAVANGQGLSPILQQMLVSKANTARAEREQLINRLEDESEELNNAREALAEIGSELDGYTTSRNLDGLAAQWDRLEEIEGRCNDVVRTRQDNLTGRRNDGQKDAMGFMEYLYSPLSVDYPVLADAVSVLEQIEDTRRSLVSAAIRRA